MKLHMIILSIFIAFAAEAQTKESSLSENSQVNVSLGGSPGGSITRDSLIKLAANYGLNVSRKDCKDSIDNYIFAIVYKKNPNYPYAEVINNGRISMGTLSRMATLQPGDWVLFDIKKAHTCPDFLKSYTPRSIRFDIVE